MIFLQLFLLALLAIPLAASRISPLFLAILYAVLVVAAFWRAFSLKGSDRSAGLLLSAAFSLISTAIALALFLGIPVFAIAGFSVVALGAFFAVLVWRFGVVECELLGIAGGYAVVKVPKSLVSVVRPGVYAVLCPKKLSGKKVRVRFSFFTKEGSVVR